MGQRAESLRDLIFVMYALKSGLVDRSALFDAFAAWDLGSGRSLVEFLIAREVLSETQLRRLERLVVEHLRQRGGEVDGSLGTIEPAGHVSTAETVGAASKPCEGPGFEETLADKGGTLPFLTAADPDSFTLTEPQRVAPEQRFEILRSHAEGGLGVVSVAFDHELNREVALKRIKDRHADDPVSRSRFLLEAEVTGGLEHPGVVPVYGLGVAQDGRPYYAMRFIHGASLKDAIADFHRDRRLRDDPGARGLELRKLLRRMVDVCNTVDYAHGRGVIHRDIKPANIMVGPYGETLLVDWGIAKAVRRTSSRPDDPHRETTFQNASGATETLEGSAMGTPAYMSPEQAAGALERLGPPSDVYSLGATLYELLTGRPPFEDTDIRRILRAVDRGDFPPPRKWDRSIPPALEAVSLKAMAHRPEDRYPTARALADDVERWMADEPVSAYREPFADRARRWMRRRRTTVTAAAASVLVALAGLTVVLAVQRQANQQLRAANVRERARFELAMEAIRTFHAGVSEDLLLGQKEYADLRKKLLGGATDFYNQVRDLLQGEADPESQKALARAYFELGEVTAKISTPADALAPHLQALEIRERLASGPGSGPEDQVDLAKSLLAVGRVEQLTKHVARAEAHMQRARGILEPLAGPEAELETRRVFARVEIALGSIYSENNRPEEAIETYTRAVGLLREVSSLEPGDPLTQTDLAAGCNLLGRVLMQQRRSERAEPYLEEARAIREGLAAASPGDTTAKAHLARTYHALGLLYSYSGRTAEALKIFDTERAMREDLVRRYAAVSVFQSDLAAVYFDQARDFLRLGRTAEALASFERSRQIEQALFEANPTVIARRRGLALCGIAIGKILSETGRAREALDSYGLARDHLETAVREQPASALYRFNLSATYFQLGQVLTLNGRPADARANFARGRDALQSLLKKAPDDSRFRMGLAENRAEDAMLLRRARPEEALAILLDVRGAQEGLVSAAPSETDFQASLATTDDRLCTLLSDLGRYSEAEAAHARARARWEELLRPNPADIDLREGLGKSFLSLGGALAAGGRWADAAAVDEQALAVLRPLAGSNPTVSRLQATLALAEKQQGVAFRALNRPADAASAFERAAVVLEALPSLSAGELYQVAAARSLRAPLVAESADELNRAAEALGRSVEEGYRDPDWAGLDPDLEALRTRPEFPLLRLDMAMPESAFGT